MDITAVLAKYVRDVTADELAQSVAGIQGYLDMVREAALQRDFVDVPMAEKIVAVLRALIEEAEEYTARERSLLAGAVSYFVDVNDQNSDLNSPTGLEDDAEILNAVSRYLGRHDLCIEIG